MVERSSPVSETVVEASAKAAAEAAGFCWENCAQEQWRRDMRAGLAVALSFGLAQCQQQWQPIETAPKDIEIFVWAPDWNKVGRRFIAKWEDNRYASKPRPYWSYCDERIWGTTKVRQCQPTRWMPLPTPPAGPDTSTDQARQMTPDERRFCEDATKALDAEIAAALSSPVQTPHESASD